MFYSLYSTIAKRSLLVLIIAVISLSGLSLTEAQDYIVGEGDVLRITVYNHPDLTTIARVTGEGEILFPLIGSVKVGDLTLSSVVEKISVRLADGYIIEPQVSVFIEEYRSKKVVLMGQVEKPGLYILDGRTTFMELLSKAGGLTKNAGDSAVIKRKENPLDASEKKIAIDLKRLVEKGDMSLDVPVMDGDSIYIIKAGLFYVTGEIRKPDSYKYEEGLTIVKAITMAGGFTDKAATGKVKIIRKLNGKEEVLERVKMDEQVLPDDVIVVPESFF